MPTKKKNIDQAQADKKELAANYVFPVKISKKSKQDADNALMLELSKRRSERKPEDRLRMALFQLRFQIKDYLGNDTFDVDKTFGYFLRLYIQTLNKRQKDFAEEIDIEPAELSSYINNHRTPPERIIVRLEIHSLNTVPAVDWYQLIEKGKVHELSTNQQLRSQQRIFVKKTADLT